jgi:hypothetical protein
MRIRIQPTKMNADPCGCGPTILLPMMDNFLFGHVGTESNIFFSFPVYVPDAADLSSGDDPGKVCRIVTILFS